MILVITMPVEVDMPVAVWGLVDVVYIFVDDMSICT